MKARTPWSVAGAVLLLLAFAFIAVNQRPTAGFPLPNPNGYDDLVAVGPSLVPNPGYSQTQSLAELRIVLQPNSNALERIHLALEKEWRVPVAFDTNYMSRAIKSLMNAKVLAQLMVAEGKLAELERRTNDALRCYADAMVLGQKCAPGGLMIDHLVGIACKALGMQETRRILDLVDSRALQHLQEKLTSIDRSREDVENILTHDKEWSKAQFGWYRYAVEWLSQWQEFRDSHKFFRAKHHRSQTEVSLLRTDVALRLFQWQTGAFPPTLNALVPRYIDSIPIDPFSGNGKPMIYHRTTNSYLLYSIGPDGVNDDGRLLSKQGSEKGDILSTPPPPPRK